MSVAPTFVLYNCACRQQLHAECAKDTVLKVLLENCRSSMVAPVVMERSSNSWGCCLMSFWPAVLSLLGSLNWICL